MAYIEIEPKTGDAEGILEKVAREVRALLKACVEQVWQRPQTDIIVELKRCEVLVPDEEAIALGIYPHAVIKIFTSDPLQELAEALKEAILTAWKQAFPHLKIEIWISFFHTWGTNIDL